MIVKNYNKKLLNWLKKIIRINPIHLSYYIEAMTHPSYANEHNLHYSYQRLEYLGDSIFGFLTANYLFQKFPKFDEGKLTELRQEIVQSSNEIIIANQLCIRNYILLGNGASHLNDIDKIIEDCFESLIGAIYLDLGLEYVNKFLINNVFKKIKGKNR